MENENPSDLVVYVLVKLNVRVYFWDLLNSLHFYFFINVYVSNFISLISFFFLARNHISITISVITGKSKVK
jgi:hypothetical protein